ncbi:hypothetical protein M413DRAFT_446168 [Hebeloma cylindrosporum]|uniref:Uncharacterized protein n=1 Tax=Hebeloma cylindrosporum TaxID=76867 RepID=A0A0C3BVZ8_HEBCY|nr:hypothetical protein M413DRAFT_446168 [Hebeloma cylindrosporum h7]
MPDLEVVVSLVIGLVMLGVVGCFVAYFRKDIVDCLTPAARRHNQNDAIPMHPSPTPLPGRFSQSLDYGRGQPLTLHPASSDPELPPTANSLPEQTSLLDRMREIQTLMVEIHHLESDPGSNNHSKIQELQQRIAELGDAQDSDTDEISSQGLGPPSGSAQDDPA